MKKIFSFSVLIILFLISFSHTAEKMGYIDSEKIINGYKGISIIREQYNKLVSEWEKEAEDKKLEIDKLKKDLKEQELMLSSEEKKKKRNIIEEKEKEYKEFIKKIWGEDGISVKKHEELVKPVIEEISNVLEKIGDEEGYTIIFDISKGNIIYAKIGLDLTNRVLDDINKEFAVVVPPETKEIKFYVFSFDEVSAEAKTKSLGRYISSLLTTGLKKFSDFESVESRRVSEVMSLHGFIKEKDLDDNQVKLVARRIEARIVVFGKINLTSGKITLNLKWINFDKNQNIITKDFSIDEKEKLEELAQDVMTYFGREIKKE